MEFAGRQELINPRPSSSVTCPCAFDPTQALQGQDLHGGGAADGVISSQAHLNEVRD